MTRTPLAPANVAFGALLAACAGTPPPPAPAPPPAPPPGDASTAVAPASQVQRLPNGVTAMLTRTRPDGDAQVQLGVFGGSLFVAKGLAELAAITLIGSAAPDRGQRALQREIEAIGGTLEIALGPMTTWFDVRVPANKVEDALLALRRALDAPTQSRSQIERMRDELVQSYSARIRRDPMTTMAMALLRGAAGTGDYVDGLLDRDPSEVSTFLSRVYRPERCLLTVESPLPPERLLPVLTDAKNGVGAWVPPPALPGSAELASRGFQSGLYWATTDAPPGPCAVAIVMYLPTPLGGAEVDTMVMHGCLTLDGTGGRLERLQDEAGLSGIRWQPEVVRGPDAIAVVLTSQATAEQVPPLWRVLRRARSSLLDVPPTPSELALAARRATLGVQLGLLDAGSRARARLSRVVRNVPADSLARRLANITEPGMFDPEAAARAYLELPVAMVVVGAGRPEASPDLRAFELLPRGFGPGKAAPDATPDGTAAEPWLAQASEAVGGADRLRRLIGFTATARLSDEQAPTLTETIEWRLSGELRRTRQLLGQQIVAVVDGDQGNETLDGTKRPLGARETALLRQEVMRHPLLLLAAHARGELQFRPIAERTVGDRDLMVLEALGDRFDRLRMHVDTGSGLVRVVESWVTLPGDTIVHVQETWSDYRSVGTLRAPFVRHLDRDDGQTRAEVVYERWEPVEGPG